MPIIRKSDENIREEVIEYLEKNKGNNPSYKVIDVGGGKNPWCDKYVDAYIDIKDFKTSKKIFIGNINEEDVWNKVEQPQFDFSICTHTLEDIRRPDFVIRKLISISKAGFIAMPNKHSELSCVESLYWVGYFHHRWIFTLLDNDKLRIVPKLPITNYFIKSNYIIHMLGKIKIDMIAEILKKIHRGPGGSNIEWINKKKVSGDFELGFIWEKSFDYEFLNNDYAGDTLFEGAKLYREKLKEGL
jgi:hypothetical protein